MTFETGIDLVDAVINNPMQAIILFGVIIFIRQFFFKQDGFFADEIRHWKWSLKYDFDKQLEKTLDWLDRRDKAYQVWAKKTTRKKFLKIELMIWCSLFVPLIIWNLVFPSDNVIGMIFVYILSSEYIFVMFFSLYRYKHPRVKRENIAN